MQITPMRLFAAVFFISLPLWILLTIVLIFSPSSGTGKADGIFGILALGSLLLMVGLRILESSNAGSGSPGGGFAA